MAGYEMLAEAEAIIKEISFAVSEIQLSEKLEQSVNCVYMNLTTKEQKSHCVQLSGQGFRIVGMKFDEVNQEEYSEFFETIYALLDTISPQYRESFGDALASKLSALESK